MSRKAKHTRLLPSGKYQIREVCTLSNGEKISISATGATISEAKENFNKKLEHEEKRIVFGEALDNGELTLAESVGERLKAERTEILPGKNRPRRPETVDRDETAVKAVITPFKALTSKKLNEITAMDMLRWKEAVDALEIGADTKNRGLSILKATIDPYCARMMESSPTLVLKYWPRCYKKKTEDDVLTPEEQKLLLKACDENSDDYKYAAASVQMMIFLRPGEVLALKVKDYDPVTHTLQIRRTVIRQHYLSEEGRVKTDDSLRDIPVPQPVHDILVKYSEGKGAEDLLFATPAGNVAYETNYNKFFKKLLKRLGINKASMHAHNLRATGISRAAMSGADMYGVSAIAGHSDISTTQKMYTAVYNRNKLAAANTLDQIYRKDT